MTIHSFREPAIATVCHEAGRFPLVIPVSIVIRIRLFIEQLLNDLRFG